MKIVDKMNVSNAVWVRARAKLWEFTRGTTSDNCRSEVGIGIRDQVNSQIWQGVGLHVWNQLEEYDEC